MWGPQNLVEGSGHKSHVFTSFIKLMIRIDQIENQ
uniref:Uncharacterized protein n=1 Tax=Rhizophora mucronata TaxID=61149 RepID=A0A2P2LSW3_RHIMU